MSEPILTFNAKSVSCDKLEKTLVGRKETVDQLFQELYEKLVKGETYQSLLVAQRGSGKTHITKVIYCRLKEEKKLEDKIVIAYMIEDEYGISSFVHLCIQILNSFVRYKESGAERIPAAINDISELAAKDQEAAIKKLLLDFIGKRGLVILLENLETIFDGMGNEAAKLRDLMHEHNSISLVATAQALTDRLTNSKYPFYHFFKTRHLERLSFDQVFELIKALAAVEEEAVSKMLLNELNNNPETRTKIRAIYELTSGNHRLIVHFFGFFKADIKSDLSKIFIKQMNDLKSYYEQFVKRLSVQQQRIVQLLSLSHQPLKGLDIAKKTFLTSGIVSKQLSELKKKGFVDKTKSGKDVFYELQEPLMRICFEINENPDGIAKLFVDFLKVIYEPEVLKKNYLLYRFGAKFQEGDFVPKYRREALMYGKALGEERTYLSPELEEELDVCSEEELVYKIEALIKEEEIDYREATVRLLKKGQFEEGLRLAEKWVESEPKSSTARSVKGHIYFEMKNYDKAVLSFEKSIRLNPRNATVYYSLGAVLHKMKDYGRSILNYDKGIQLDPGYVDAYYNLGVAFYEIKEYGKAILNYKKAIQLNPNDTKVYYNLGTVFHMIKDYEKSILNYEKAIQLDSEYANAYYNLGSTFSKIRNYEKARLSYEKAIQLSPNDADVYNNLGNVFYYSKDYEKAISSYKKTIELEGEYSYTYGSLLRVYIAQGNLEKAEIQLLKIFAFENFEAFFLIKSICLTPMVEHLDVFFIEKFLKMLIAQFEKADKLDSLYNAFPPFLFHVLTNLETYEKEKIQFLKNHLDETFASVDKMKIPLLMLNVGIRYLAEGDKRALFDLSKEERKIFNDFVLLPREELKGKS